MPVTVGEVSRAIDGFAPYALAEEWDNVGILAGSENMEVTGVLCALDLNFKVIEEARAKGANLIVTHHPILFRGRKNLREDDAEGRMLCKLIRAGIALIAAQMARIAGAEKILLCGCTSDVSYRLKIAEQLNCFDRFINVQTEDAVSIIMEETVVGADLVVEASGAGSAIRTSIRVLKKRGVLCAIGMTAAPTVEVPWNEAMMKVLDVQFNMSSSYNGWEIALSLLGSGKLDVEPLFEVRSLLDWEQAFADLEQGRAMKILLTPVTE